MGAFANMLSGASGLFEGDHSTDGGVKANLGQMLQGAGGVGSQIAKVGNAATGHISPGGASPVPAMGGVPAATPTSPMVAPAVAQAMQGNITGGHPIAAIGTPGTGTIPSHPSPVMPSAPANGPVAAPVGTGIGTYNGGDVNNVYGEDTGGAITNLLNSENPTGANSTAQAIIAANAPNVARGSADLNTGLAAGGISPSSSVSAIENANYEGQVQQQNLAELANINLTEQERQQQLLETLLPSQQQRQTDSSGWSIFGDIMSGVGDIGSLVAGL